MAMHPIIFASSWETSASRKHQTQREKKTSCIKQRCNFNIILIGANRTNKFVVCCKALRQICGVLQGLILGPLFFIFYINDLPACSNELEFILFADDTSIFFEHSDLDVLTSHLNDQLNNVSTWLKANKLSINVKKTKLMIFRPRQKTLPITRQQQQQ